MTKRHHLGVLMCALLGPALTAHAQSRLPIPPNRPDQTAAPPPAPAPDRRLGAPGPRARSTEGPIQAFQLTSVEVVGSTLAAERLRPGYQRFIGQRVDRDALGKITQAIADIYAGSDIALYTVLVPDQGFEGGHLKLAVVEGYVQGVAIHGHVSPKAERLIQRLLRPVEGERPLRKRTLQRAVSLIRDIPGLYPSLDFERGDQEGAVRLVITGAARAAQLSLGVNNRGTALLGRTQAQVDAFANSLLIGGDQLKGSVALPSDGRQFQFYGLGYSAPLDANGATLQANLGYLRTKPRSIPLQGSATSFGLLVSHPFIRSFDRNLYGTIGLDGVDSDNAVVGSTLSNDHTRAFRAAAAYSLSGAKNSITVSATLSFGINGLGARTLTPANTDLEFKKLNVKLIDNVVISRNLVLRLDGLGQASADRLPASEQLALGGDEFGRAYEAAIISGDYGLAGSAELAYRPAKRIPKRLQGSEVYVFVDDGKVWTHARNGQPEFSSTLASIGLGARADIARRVVIQLEAARGLYNPVNFENREVWRVLYSIRTLF